MDVAILGAGIAGLAAAARLGPNTEMEIFEEAHHIGGRTKSEALDANTWANFGAQYISNDKIKLVELSARAGVNLIRAPFGSAGAAELGNAAIGAQVQRQIERVEAEQARPRPAEERELDDQTFLSWLGPCSDEATSFWNHWAGRMLCCSISEVSLYGVLWFWGEQRTSPWTVEPVERAALDGPCVVQGGTGELARGLARVSGAKVCLGTAVESVLKDGHGGYLIETQRAGRPLHVRARKVICALPASIAARVCRDMPDWKTDALRSVHYGRFLSTPIRVTSVDRPVDAWRATPFRPGQIYNGNDFRLRTPGDIDADGCVFHSYVYDKHARQIWKDPDESIKSGAVNALLQRFPEFGHRISWVGIQRWRYGLPHYSPGHMKRIPSLCAPVDGIHFCGDYCSPANMEGAARSGERAADEIR